MSVETQVLVVRDLPSGVGVSYGGDFVTQRPSRIATLPVGYADGYPRALSGKASVLINAHRAPILGRVCMDMCMVDVTDLPFDVNPGDSVTLMGRSGDAVIDAWDLATWADTITILTGFSERSHACPTGLTGSAISPAQPPRFGYDGALDVRDFRDVRQQVRIQVPPASRAETLRRPRRRLLRQWRCQRILGDGRPEPT